MNPRTGVAFEVLAGAVAVVPGVVRRRDAGALVAAIALLALSACSSIGGAPPAPKVAEIMQACISGDAEVVERLLDEDPRLIGPDQRNQDLTPLHMAATWGQVEVVELLIARKADLNARETKDGRTPLGWAIYRNNSQVAEILRSAGARE